MARTATGTLKYGPASDTDIRIFYDTAVECPAVVMIHGGGFTSGSIANTYDLAVALGALGFCVFNASYPLASAPGTNPYPTAIEFLRDNLVPYVRANGASYNALTDKVGALGVSVGGHLAMWLGIHKQVDAVVSWSGPTAFDRDYTYSAGGGSPTDEFSQYFNVTAQQMVDGDYPAQTASPAYNIPVTMPPVYVGNSSTETYTPVGQATYMASQLDAAAVGNVLKVVVGSFHGGNLEDYLLNESAAFLFRHLSGGLVHTQGVVTAQNGGLLASCGSRRWARLQNESPLPIFLGMGADAVVGKGIPLRPGQAYEMSRAHGNLYAGKINAIHAYSGEMTVLVTEEAAS